MKKHGKYLCMGCSKYFPKSEVEIIEGVAFCGNCEAQKKQFVTNRLEVKAQQAAPQRLGYGSSEDEAKWEASFDTSAMIHVTTGRARRLHRPIDISRAKAGITSRLLAALIDLSPVAAYGWWQHHQGATPTTFIPLCVAAAGGILVYRVLFNVLFGRSVGMVLANVRVVDPQTGRPAGFVSAVLHGLLILPGALVQDTVWKREAARAVYFDEREGKRKIARTVTAQKPNAAGTKTREVAASEPFEQAAWSDPDWKPPGETISDPWTDPNWKPPEDSPRDPWNDPNH